MLYSILNDYILYDGWLIGGFVYYYYNNTCIYIFYFDFIGM